MPWYILLMLLICPLMMLFCMKGHGSNHKHHDSNISKDLDKKVTNLKAENEILKKEIDNLSSYLKKES